MDFEGQIILMQTASGPAYEAMLEATEAAHRQFCAINRVEMVRYIGVRRGPWSWQAAFNRIEMLNDLSDFDGWVMYLDADAVIRHLEFDIRRFLGKRSDYALIASPGSPSAQPWEINDGVFFLNFGHPKGRLFAQRWHWAFHAQISDEDLKAASEPFSLPTDDQHLLQIELLTDAQLMKSVCLESPMTINHRGAKFIRQFMRSHGSTDERLKWIKAEVSGFAC